MAMEAGYATRKSGELVEALTHRKPGGDNRWLFAGFLLQAYREGYLQGLQDGHKVHWVVMRKLYDNPDGPGTRYVEGLAYPIAIEVCKVANRADQDGRFYYDIEPDAKI